MSKLINVSKDANENYLAKVILVKDLQPVDGLDNLVRLVVDRRDILTQKGTAEGTIAIYFPSGSAINPKYLSVNNEYRADTGLNEDRLSKGGFFEEKGRVKPVRFKGNMSDGYIAPAHTLEPIIGDKYKELGDHVGEYFDALGDFVLLQKYMQKKTGGTPGVPKTRDRNLKKYESRVIDKQFHFHYDTSHLDKNLHRIQPEDLISITWKFHGTSFISSKVLCKRRLTRLERFARWLGINVFDKEYSNLYASRSVIKNEELSPNAQHYYGEDIYKLVNDVIEENLFTGETVYGEIVGFTPSGTAIQGKYDYGCKPKEHKAYVYRITYTGFDGNVVDLPYELMAARCKELGVEPVKLIFQGKAKDLVDNRKIVLESTQGFNRKVGYDPMTDEEWREAFYQYVKTTYVYNQNSAFCVNKVPEEGVVIRKEALNAFALKLVADAYKLGESKAKDAGTLDMEEEQDGTEQEPN